MELSKEAKGAAVDAFIAMLGERPTTGELLGALGVALEAYESVRVAPAPAGQHDAVIATFDGLHSKIMNLPCVREPNIEMPAYWYKRGHREARHAAAELVSEATSRAQRTGKPS